MNSQRAIVFFLWKEGTPTCDIEQRLSHVFGDDAMERAAVFKWVQRFQTGRESLVDDSREWPPNNVCND